jgi:hypothetical protein
VAEGGARVILEAQYVWSQSNGNVTSDFYAKLSAKGPIGEIAVNLFRANKSSARAKHYHGGDGTGSFRGKAYDRKQESIAAVCTVLSKHAAKLGIKWGWQKDETTPGFEWVIYIDLPQGQVSFHGPARGSGPMYLTGWDGKRLSTERICAFCDAVMREPDSPHIADDPVLPFGKFAGKHCSEVDVEYLDWLIGQDWLRADLRTSIEKHLKSRQEWREMDHE